MSCLKMATKAANTIVAKPTLATTPSNSSVPPRIGYSRIIMNRPALTIVAECR